MDGKDATGTISALQAHRSHNQTGVGSGSALRPDSLRSGLLPGEWRQ